MSVANMRKRQAKRVPEGGGVTARSLQDTATDDDWQQQYSGRGPNGLMGDVELDYDQDYSDGSVPPGTPQPDAYTHEEARQDMADFVERPYERAQRTRDVAQQWNAGLVTLAPGADAYLIAGADPLRKRLVIRNRSVAAANLADVLLCEEPTISGQGGSGTLLLKAGVTGANVVGDEISLTATGAVWARISLAGGGTEVAATLTYLIERYNK